MPDYEGALIGHPWHRLRQCMIEVGKEASQGKRDDGGDGQVERRLKPPGLSDLPREVLYLVYCTCTASIPNNKTASAPLPQLHFFLPAFVFIFIKHLLLSIDSHIISSPSAAVILFTAVLLSLTTPT